MFAFRIAWLIVLCAIGIVATARPLAAQTPTAAPSKFSAEEQQARQAILTSYDWQEAHVRFNTWLSVQTLYDPAQVENMRREFAKRIEAMSADELKAFLKDMQQRLDVLLSPDVAAARRWADAFYTEQGKKKLVQEHHLADPISMSADELTAALSDFAADRQAETKTQAAFQKGQSAQAAAIAEATRAQRRRCSGGVRGSIAADHHLSFVLRPQAG